MSSGIVQLVGQTSGVSHLLAVSATGSLLSADSALLAKNTLILAKNAEIEVSCNALIAANHTDLVAIEASADALIAANHTDLVAIEASADALIAANHTDLVAVIAKQTAFIAANHTDLVAIDSTLGGTLSVSAPAISATATLLKDAVSVSDSTAEVSASVDMNTVRDVQIFGNLNDTSGTIVVQVSRDNSTFFNNSEQTVYVESSGNFAKTMSINARYVRFSYTNGSGSTKVWTLISSTKA